MYFIAFATDYDGTLAEDGLVARSTLEALELLKQSGRKLILVSGRELPDLQRVFPNLNIFDLAVLENGALLFEPANGQEIPLAEQPPALLIEELHRRNVAPLSIGRSIVATWEPNEKIVLEVIRDLGLELQIIFNKGAVMVLPAGVNKASGLARALARLQLSPLNVVGIGDAENDHAFLRACGCAAAVANALPMVKADADIVTSAPRGDGVAETIRHLLDNDLADIAPRIECQTVEFAHELDGNPIRIHSQCGGVLIAGASRGGESTVAAGFIERILDRAFQFCIVDPEGDYADLAGAVVLGDAKAPPRVAEVIELLRNPEQSVVLSLLGVDFAERPRFVSELVPALSQLRVETARPHWVVIDEAHHLLPSNWDGAPVILPREFPACVLITVHPQHVAPKALQGVEYVVAVGAEADEAIASFCDLIGEPPPPAAKQTLERGQALLWSRNTRQLQLIETMSPRQEQQRHIRKYVEGELGEDKSFYFRGSKGALNLRAQNLEIFVQIAEGIDDDTWLHHLSAGDYSRWFRDAIKDDDLAEEAAAIESDRALSASQSRQHIKDAINSRYTSPA
jgi:hydroxymethylpyrimidine pyrophosphatase-like HAD family hydrolase